MQHLRILFGTLLIFIANFSFSQSSFPLKGRIVDAKNQSPLSFASVKVFQNNKMLTGNVSNENGEFEFKVAEGKYLLEVEFIGYKKYASTELILTNEGLNLGDIAINPSDQSLDELVVQGEKSSMELSLDKRVFNVGKDLANAGGSASDILVNIPSVTVDPDGAIKLRGSSNVRILIDGKPSGMVSFKGGAGLRQLQASMIERVEIITNPSARYEAEGQAGIINIILKKDSKQGFNGSFELITGNPTNYGFAANLNYRHRKVNFFINYGLAYRWNPYKGDLYQEVYDGDTTKILNQDNKGDVSGFDNNIRGGIEYYFTEKSVLTGSYMFSRAGGIRYTKNVYQDFLNSQNNPLGTISRIQDEVEKEPLSEYVLSYKKSFNKKGHELTGQFRYLDHSENSDQTFSQTAVLPNGKTDLKNTLLQTSINDEFEKQYLFQLDYVQPFAKEGKFELGARSSLRNMVNDFVVNDKIDGKEIPIDWLDNYFIYDENISAAYGIVSNKAKKISYQLGLRSEWTDVSTTLQKTNEFNPRKYFNLFPSSHFTYALNTDNSLQVSYSRRIRRPVYNDLSPFMTLSDSRNFNSGNPNLNPEYSDVYEVGHLKNFEKGSFTSSIYYRNAQDAISRIRRVDENGFSTNRPENLVSEKAYGLDFTANYKLFKWWKFDLNFNLFHANIDGSNINELYVVETNTWFARQTSRFTLPKGYDMQLRFNYEAAQKTAQGSSKAIYFFDYSLKKDILKKKGSINFSVLDIFNTRWSRTISQGPGFYTESNRQFRPRQINLTFSYRLKQ
ncbi:TonB-dependent receptor [Lacihabitans sp. LS3-19]|uniref:TonB-dependent receptor domain-containing protein n=1 Tax=Lacihabitans sp. LS3-19 TaxID=2487335 RepID=UPI0020CF1940|nr:TonB-dependent receptor [Lacihabitans sp. LS3-19]MCP9768665.1 TonB-dependent receptor [Lacihabitans sp. LS3-19]